MKYLKDFETNSAYDAYMESAEKVIPNVSYIIESDDIKYHTITSVTASVVWKKDVSCIGGVADKDNCSYTVIGKNFEGITMDITKMVSVSGSLEVLPTMELFRHSAGTLVLTFKIGDKVSASASTVVYQEKQKYANFTSMVEQSVNLNMQVDGLEYSYGETWQKWNDTTTALPFGESGVGETIYFRGTNDMWADSATNVTFQFGTSATVDVNGSVMSLIGLEDNPGVLPDHCCFNGLFSGATALHTVGSGFLPADTISPYCYASMFKGCSNLFNVPNLPAFNLTEGCYMEMFSGCSKVGEIVCEAMVISAVSCTTNWTAAVSGSGYFYGTAIAPWELDSPNGIPVNWENIGKGSIRFTSQSAQTVSLVNLGGNAPYLEYSFDAEGWNVWDYSAIDVNNGKHDSVFIRGLNPSGFCRSAAIRSMFKFGDNNVMVDMGGNMMALQNYSAVTTSIPECGFIAAFSGSTALRSVAKSVLPATSMARSGCQHTFRACTNLVNSPVIRVGLADASGLYAMFYGCTSLVDVPDFPNMYYIAHGGCHLMFAGCKSLKKAPNIPKLRNIETNGLRNAFDGCTALEEGPDVLNCTNVKWRGCEQTFRGCKNLVKAPILNFGKLDGYAMEGMFNGCTKLNEVHCTATGWSESTAVANWLANVASAGTFYGKPDTPWVIDSPNGVPVGWTWVEKHSIQMTASAPQTVTAPSGSTMEYSYDGKNWTAMTEAVGFGVDNNIVYIRGKNASGLNYKAFALGNSASTVALAGNIQSLLDWKTLPNTVPASGFMYTFNDCKAITSVNNTFLPATTLSNYCYCDLFRFASITKAPALPASAMTEHCYQGMFYGDTALITPPALPSTALNSYCYCDMFSGCTNMTTAPELPAETLKYRCYYRMFGDCAKVNEIHCSAKTISAGDCTANWLKNVASAGTFYGYIDTPWVENSSNGIPVGWTWVEKHSIQMTASAAQTVTAPSGSTMEYSYNGKVWSAMTAAVEFGTTNPKVYIRGKNTSGLGDNNFVFGNETALVDINGNAMALLDWETLPTEVPESGLRELFSGAAALQSVSSKFLPATTIGNRCYYGMFGNCTSLTSAPALPATETKEYCYCAMFRNCSALKTPPALPATAMTLGCYSQMFSQCTSLETAPALPAITLEEFCYTDMFNECKSLTKAPSLPADTMKTWSCYGMFSGCTNLNEIHCDATDISASSCVVDWVAGVASTGDFYGKTAAGWTDGISGIPNGWTKHLS